MEQKKYVCGHCNATVSKTQYFKHKKLFYDAHLKVWRSERIPPPVESGDDFFLYEDDDRPVSGDADIVEEEQHFHQPGMSSVL